MDTQIKLERSSFGGKTDDVSPREAMPQMPYPQFSYYNPDIWTIRPQLEQP